MNDNYEDSIVTRYYIDENGIRNMKEVIEEQQVSPGKNIIQLTETPDVRNGVTIVNRSNMVQVEDIGDVGENENYYFVSTDGLVYFHPNLSGKTIKLKYKSVGVTLLSSNRVFYKDESDTPKILEDLISKGYDANAEYENLKAIMIDENNAVNLQNQVNKTNSQLEQKAQQSDLLTEKSRIDNLVGNYNPTEGNSELLDGRIGSNGESFGSLGNHVRKIEKGHIKDIKHDGLSDDIYKSNRYKTISVDGISANYGGLIHCSIYGNVPYSGTIEKINSVVEFESNSPYITKIQQRFDFSPDVLTGIETTDTITSLNETFNISSRTVTVIRPLLWITCSVSNKNVVYKIKKWIITINDEIKIDLINDVARGVSFSLPFGATGNLNKITNNNYGIVNRKQFSNLSKIKNYLLGLEGFNFVNGKNVDITEPFDTGNGIYGFIKMDKAFSELKNINSFRVKGKIYSLFDVYEFEPVIEITDNLGVKGTFTVDTIRLKQAEINEIDSILDLTEKNKNISKITVYLRVGTTEKIPFNFDIGDIEVYINGSLEGNFSPFSMSFSKGSITDIKNFVDKNEISNYISIAPLLKNKKIIFFGDSIFDTNLTPKATPYFVASLTGATQYNYAVASSGFNMNAEYSSNVFGKDNTYVAKMIERSKLDNITPDYCVLGAGTNDWDFQKKPLGTLADAIIENPTIDTFYGSLGLAYRTLINTYPYAKYLFVTPLPRKIGIVTQHTQKANGLTLINYRNAIVEVCEYFSIPYLDATFRSNLHLENSEVLNTYMTDGLHPSSLWAEKGYAPLIIKELERI